MTEPRSSEPAQANTTNPIHLIEFTGASSASEPAPRRPLQRLFRAAAATLAAGLLVGGVAAPLMSQPFVSSNSAAAASVLEPQHLSGTGGTALGSGERAFDTISPIESAPEAKPGAPDLSGLASSKVRYPFDAQVPLTDPFGYRTAPVAQFHDAQDFAAADGTPIRIIASGIVLEAGQTIDGCGFGLKVQHNIGGRDVTSRYCHMQNDSSSYRVGDRVKIGDTAGRVGATGMAFGAHLHLAMRQDDVAIDPMVFLTKNIGRG